MEPIFNRITLNMAGQRGIVWGIVRHVGRRSGRVYSTPVWPDRVSDGFVIPLPYGRDVDWFRNVLAANQFTLRWHGRDYVLYAPEVVEAEGVRPLLPPLSRALTHVFKIDYYLRAQLTPQTGTAIPPRHEVA